MTSSSRTVRVFISSTFRDFGEERDLLVKRVFPELRRRARERLVEVIGVDLRWGIPEEKSRRGETLPLCLREIEQTRPHFLGLLGERYGWTPRSSEYPASLLTTHPWLDAYAGRASVTELEILHGVLNHPAMAGRARFYFRDPSWSAGRGLDFRSESDEDRARLDRLKRRIRESAFPVGEYATPGDFAERVIEDLWAAIESDFPISRVPNAAEGRDLLHRAYAIERCRLHVGQEDAVRSLCDRVRHARDGPGAEDSLSRVTIVTGGSGSGKSALIANAIRRIEEHDGSTVTFIHHVGSADDSSDPAAIIRRLAEWVQTLCEAGKELENDRERLLESAWRWMEDASSWAVQTDRLVLIALDGLERLTSETRLAWLPLLIPPRIRLVLSSSGGLTLDRCQERGYTSVSPKSLCPEDAKRLLSGGLAPYGRAMSTAAMARVASHPQAVNPGFLRALTQELIVFGSHEGLDDFLARCLSAASAKDLFGQSLDRLELDVGEPQLRRAMIGIWSGGDGMSEDEVLEWSGMSPMDWARTTLGFEGSLIVDHGLIRFGSEPLACAVERRYLSDTEKRKEWHRELGRWWQSRGLDKRPVRQAFRNLERAGDVTSIRDWLLHPSSGPAALRYLASDELVRTWDSVRSAHTSGEGPRLIEQSYAEAWPAWAGHATVSHDLLAFFQVAGCYGPFARDVARQAVEAARDHAESQEQLAGALCDAGLLAETVGERAAAAELYEEAIAIRRGGSPTPGRPDQARSVGILLERLARTAEAGGDWSRCDTHLQELVRLMRLLVDSHASAASRRDLAVVLDRLGRLKESLGATAEARAAYEESLELRERLADRSGLPESYLELAWSHDHLGFLDHAAGDLAGAEQRFRAAFSLRQDHADAVGTPTSRRDLSLSHENLAGIALERGDPVAAEDHATQCLRIRRDVAGALGTPESRRDVLVALEKMGSVHEARGRPDPARSCYLEMAELARLRVEGDPVPEAQRDLAAALGNLGDVERRLGMPEAAARSYREMLDACRTLLGMRVTRSRRRDVAVCLGKTVTLAADELPPPHGDAEAEEMLEIYRELLADDPNPVLRRELALALGMAGDLDRSHGRADRACARHEEALECLNAIREVHPTSRLQVDRANVMTKLGEDLLAMGSPARSLGVFHAIREEIPSPDDGVSEFVRRLLIVVATLGSARAREAMEDLATAASEYRKVLDFFDDLTDVADGTSHWLARARAGLIRSLLSLGDADQAFLMSEPPLRTSRIDSATSREWIESRIEFWEARARAAVAVGRGSEREDAERESDRLRSRRRRS